MKANEEFELGDRQIQEALDRACTSNYIYTVKYSIKIQFNQITPLSIYIQSKFV